MSTTLVNGDKSRLSMKKREFKFYKKIFEK